MPTHRQPTGGFLPLAGAAGDMEYLSLDRAEAAASVLAVAAVAAVMAYFTADVGGTSLYVTVLLSGVLAAVSATVALGVFVWLGLFEVDGDRGDE